MIKRQQGGIIPQVFTNQQDVGPFRQTANPISTGSRIQTDFSPVTQGIQFGLQQGLREADFRFRQEQAAIDNSWREKELAFREEKFNFEKKLNQWQQLNLIKDSITGDDILLSDYDRYKEIIDGAINPSDVEAAYNGDEEALSRVQTGVASVYASPEIGRMNRRSKVADDYLKKRGALAKATPDGYFDPTQTEEAFNRFINGQADETDLYNSLSTAVQTEDLVTRRNLDLETSRVNNEYNKFRMNEMATTMANTAADRAIADRTRTAIYNEEARRLGQNDFESSPPEIQDTVIKNVGTSMSDRRPSSGDAYIIDRLFESGNYPSYQEATKAYYDMAKRSVIDHRGGAGAAGGVPNKDGSIDYGTYGLSKTGEATYGTFGVGNIKSPIKAIELKDDSDKSLQVINGKVWLKVKKNQAGLQEDAEFLEELGYTRGNIAFDADIDEAIGKNGVIDAGDSVLIPSHDPSVPAATINAVNDWNIKPGVTVDVEKMTPETMAIGSLLNDTGLFTVTSAYRSPESDAEISTGRGAHTRGEAIDYRWTKEAEEYINNPAVQAQFEAMGYEISVHEEGTAKHIHMQKIGEVKAEKATSTFDRLREKNK